jgi:hypothetical protein
LKAIRAAEHAAIARNRKHDHDRIRARKVLGLAGGAIAPPTSFDDLGRGPASRAKAMSGMPIEKRFTFGERRQMIELNEALHRDRAQVDDDELVVRLKDLGDMRVEPDCEAGRIPAEAEKDDLGGATERARFWQCEQGIGNGGGALEDHLVAGDEIGARVPLLLKRRERGGIRAPLGRALD